LIFYIFPRLLGALQFARLDPAIEKLKRKINEKKCFPVCVEANFISAKRENTMLTNPVEQLELFG
jgi:hypothetical protein